MKSSVVLTGRSLHQNINIMVAFAQCQQSKIETSVRRSTARSRKGLLVAVAKHDIFAMCPVLSKPTHYANASTQDGRSQSGQGYPYGRFWVCSHADRMLQPYDEDHTRGVGSIHLEQYLFMTGSLGCLFHGFLKCRQGQLTKWWWNNRNIRKWWCTWRVGLVTFW